MSRTRLLRPGFFSDELMAQLSLPSRFIYMGLWTMTDDAGYLDASVREIGAELLRFDPPRRREAMVEKALGELENLEDRNGKPEPRIIRLDCGDHLVIPTIPEHRTQGGEKVFTIKRRHETRCMTRSDGGRRRPTSETTSGYVPESVSDSSSFSDSVSNSAQARTTTRRSMDEMMADAGRGLPFVERQLRRRTGGATA